jgi:tetratricopeptide (TPR) repeat protein/CHAT domain-containing protein
MQWLSLHLLKAALPADFAPLIAIITYPNQAQETYNLDVLIAFKVLMRLSILQNLLRKQSRAISLLLAGLALVASTNLPSAAANTTEGSVIPMLPELSQTPETMDKLGGLEDAANKLMDAHQLDKALIKWQECYGLSIEMKYSEGQGRALTNMCRIYRDRGQLSHAKELGENAIEVLSGVINKRALAKARVELAQVYFAMDNPAWAGQQLSTALEEFAASGASDAPDAARVLAMTGDVLIKRGQIKEAIQFYQGASSFYGQANDRRREVGLRIYTSQLLNEMGWYTAAAEETKRAVTVAGETKDPTIFVPALAAQGNALYNLGEFANALSSYDAGRVAPVNYKDELTAAQILAGYGSCLAATGNVDFAVQCLDKAYSVFRQKAPAAHQAILLNTMGCTEAKAGQDAKAIQHLTQALDLLAISQHRVAKLNVIVLQNLAICEMRTGDARSAKAHLRQALEVLKKNPNTLLEARTYACLGEVCLNMKEVQESETFLRQGIALSEKIHDDASSWRDYTNLARLQVAQRQDAMVTESLTSALSFFRSPQAGLFPSPEQLEFPSPRESIGHQLVSLLVSQKMPDAALLVCEQLKDETFINDWYRQGGQVRSSDKGIYNDLTEERSHLHAAESNITPDKALADWQKWMARFSELVNENPQLARLIAPVPVRVEEITKRVKETHITIVDYLIGIHSTVVFVIGESGNIETFTLATGRKQLDAQIAAFLASTTNKTSTTPETATDNGMQILRTLGRELMPTEIRQLLPKDPEKVVVIVPDGALFNLPFSALIDESGKYLVQEHTLTCLPTLSGIANADVPLIGDSASGIVVATPNTGQSVASGSEARAITNVFGTELVAKVTGKESEIANFQQQAQGKSYLHFALPLNLPQSNALWAVLPFFTNKEVSGGKLNAVGLFKLPLTSDVAIWSGTVVNPKDTHGQAIKMFSRGLGYAGCKSVLMSLWQAPEYSRATEIGEFYKNKKDGLSEAQALRNAELLAISKNASPRNWAAFQLFGLGM